MCIIGGIALGILIASFLLYLSHLEKKKDELQYKLSEGAKLYRESILNDDFHALSRCEEIFNSIAKEKRGEISEIATMYLAKIKEKKGDKREAKRLVENVRESSKNPIIRELAERASRSLQ